MNLTLKCSFYLTITLTSLLFFCSTVMADLLVAEIDLNGETKGTFFLQTTPEGDYLMRLEDYDGLGFVSPAPATLMIDQEAHVSLAELEGISFVLNEETLTLEIQAASELLPSKTIDLRTTHSENVLYPRDTSLFFNYGVNYLYEGLSKEDIYDLTHEIGLRYQDFLFISDATYVSSDDQQEYIRLMTTISHDDRTRYNRSQLGDCIATSGTLGSRMNLGGISYSRNFDIDPHYIEYPTASYSGEALTPSELEVYMDGLRIYSEKIAPGPFNLSNIHRHSGAGNLEVIVTDAFGNREMIIHPFYIERNLLKAGEHAYQYALGAIREEFGSESNAYGDTALVAQHRYGMADKITLGIAAEAASDLINVRPQGSFLLGPYGVLDVTAGGSSGFDESGGAFSLAYTYLNRHFDVHLLGRFAAQGYRKLSDGENPTELEESALGIGFGYIAPRFGSFSIDYLNRSKHIGTDQSIFSVSYNRQLARNLTLTSTFRHNDQIESESSVFFSLNYSPWRETQLSARIEIGDNRDSEIVQVQKNPPLGEGYGYRVALEHQDNGTNDDFAITPSGQLNSRYGIFRAEVDSVNGDTSYTSYQLSAAGALVAVGSRWGMTRPIVDSFALVKVGNLANVEVSRNSQYVGKTDPNGELFIPDINAFYTNHVAINDQNVPLNYSLAFNQQLLAPPFRSGSCIIFPSTRMQPIIGRLLVTEDGKSLPLEYTLQTVIYADQRYPLHTGKGGDFYIDPGEYSQHQQYAAGCGPQRVEAEEEPALDINIEINYNERVYLLTLDIPESEDLFIDVGEIGPIIHE